jgi:hypothetical protein
MMHKTSAYVLEFRNRIFTLVVALMSGKERRGFLFLVYDVVRLFFKSLDAANNNDPPVTGPSSPTEVFQLIVTMTLCAGC